MFLFLFFLFLFFFFFYFQEKVNRKLIHHDFENPLYFCLNNMPLFSVCLFVCLCFCFCFCFGFGFICLFIVCLFFLLNASYFSLYLMLNS